jgi:hypothetical protein
MKKRAENAFTENRKNNNCFNNLFIKQKCHNISNLYINDNNSNNIDNMKYLNLCSLTPQKTSNNVFNEKESSKKYFLIDKNKNKCKTNIKREKNSIIKKKLSFYNNYNSNNENNYKKILNDCNIDDKINFILQHKKINFSKLNKNMYYRKTDNKYKKKKNQSFIESAKTKYKTVLTKYNTKIGKNSFLPQESNHQFEIFSSKYNNNNLEFNKLPFYEQKQPKYFRTENSSSINTNIFLESKANYISFPNLENIKIFNTPKLFISNQNQNLINFKFIFEKIKNNKLHNKYITRLLNIKNELSLDHVFIKDKKDVQKKEGVKYSAVNLNQLAQIPNRIMPIDNHGKELDGLKSFKNSKKRIMKKKNNASNQLRQSFGDIKLLRRQICNNYHSNEITRHNSKESSEREELKTNIPKNKIIKTFCKCSIIDLNEKDSSKRKSAIRRNYLSGKLTRRFKRIYDFGKM